MYSVFINTSNVEKRAKNHTTCGWLDGLFGKTGNAFIPLALTFRPYLLLGRSGVLSGVMVFPLSTPTARGATLGNMGIGCALPKVQAEERSDEAKVAKERVDRAD